MTSSPRPGRSERYDSGLSGVGASHTSDPPERLGTAAWRMHNDPHALLYARGSLTG
jgi:hypothetical protein